ncbi:MAG: response regulator [Planctomycetes bacterium]|nr:response regulator [Planctomycetota bacterium]
MGFTALVADDSMTMRAIISDTLRDLGVEAILEAENAEQAFSMFSRNTLNLVILDWYMPGRSGVDVIRAIRATGSQVPIVMVTAGGTAREQVTEAVQAGASDYLLKPFKPEVLREKLEKFCCCC